MLLKVAVVLLFISSINGANEWLLEIFDLEVVIVKVRETLSGRDDADLLLTQMVDSSTKIPSGLLNGNFFDFGNFDGCYSIKSEDIYGKYCLGTYPVTAEVASRHLRYNITELASVKKSHAIANPQLRLMGAGPEYRGLHFAVCVPHTLEAGDIPGTLTYTEDFCYSKATEKELSAGAIATIAFLSTIGLIIVLSTTYDVVLLYRERKPAHELLVAFSFFSNGQKLFSLSTSPDQLLCLNGIKSISMMWVVLGHDYSNALNGPIGNFYDVVEFNRNPGNMFIKVTTISVDSFLVAGGLVIVYTFLKSTARGVRFNLFTFYLHRYLRLTPVLLVVILFHLFLLEYVGNGPLWKTTDILLIDDCREAWWSTLLYISNYIQKYSCISPVWYLNVDMQLFILAPLVLIPLVRWPKYGLSALVFLALGGVLIPFGIAYAEHLTVFVGNTGKTLEMYYIQPYTRFGPYILGMICGYFIYKLKTGKLRIKLSWWMVCLSWVVSLTGLAACIWASHDLSVSTIDDRWGFALYIAFNRPAWGLALCVVIFLCIAGYGGPINSFLSLPIFQILTKLSYSMYLTHFCISSIRYASMKETFRFANAYFMHIFWSDFMVTMFVSIVLSLAFESPIVILEKYLFGRGTSKSAVSKKKAEI